MNKKVAIFGAGNVGAETARRIAERELADVMLVDVLEGMPQGKALDMLQSGSVERFNSKITGTNDPADIEGSDIVVVTAGLARKPGMSRDDLQILNAKIIRDIASNIKKYAPNSILIMVTNPVDVMTYLAYKVTGFDRKKVIGMAGILDSSRMATFISMELGIPVKDVECMVLGGHGDLMVPVMSQAKAKHKPVSELLPKDKIKKIIERTQKGGAEIVNLLKVGSAYYAPSSSAVAMVRAIIKDKKFTSPCSILPGGEYGLSDVCIGVPVTLGKSGVEKIEKIKLTEEEASALAKSANSVKEQIAKLSI
ncbi:malate dehydrogenase [Candidatus Margulisiibacteriota bacterium]